MTAERIRGSGADAEAGSQVIKLQSTITDAPRDFKPQRVSKNLDTAFKKEGRAGSGVDAESPDYATFRREAAQYRDKSEGSSNKAEVVEEKPKPRSKINTTEAGGSDVKRRRESRLPEDKKKQIDDGKCGLVHVCLPSSARDRAKNQRGSRATEEKRTY